MLKQSKIIKNKIRVGNMSGRENLLKLSVIVAILQSNPVFALEESTENKSTRLIEEVVVTAQKREQSLQDVPISVNAFSADDAVDKGLDNPIDLNIQVPSFQFGSTAGFTTAFLRGVGSDAFLMADPSIALYIDGVYFPFAHGLAQSFGEVERIEILKGPQGTLFGRNATGGAINVVTKSPGDEFGVSLLASRSSWDTTRMRGSINLPVTEALSISLSGIKNTVGQYYENGTVAGKKLPKDESSGGRVKIRFELGDRIELNLNAFQLKQDGINTLFMPNTEPSPLASTVGGEAARQYEGDVDAPAYFYSENTVYYGSLKVNTDLFDVKLLASDQYMANDALFDLDGTDVPIATLKTEKLFADVQSAELQLNSNENTWGSDWLSWILGAYYFQSLQGFDPLALTPLTFQGNGLDSLLSPLPQSVINLVNEIVDVSGQPQLELSGLVDTTSTALYFQTDISIFEWLSLTLGGRFQNENRAIAESKTDLRWSNGLIPNINLFTWERREDTTKSFSPKISLNLYPTEDMLVYINWQEATKSSAFNVTKLTAQPDQVKPEEMEAYEIGFKNDFFGQSVRLNAAAFLYNIKNLQTQFVSLFAGGVTSFENADDTRITGFDYDLTVAIMPSLVNGLFFKSSGAYVDAKFEKYVNGTGFDEESGLYFSDGDFSGNRVTRSPEKSANASLIKEFYTDFGDFKFAVDYYYNSGFYFTSQNSESSWQDSYHVVGAQATYEYLPWGLKLTAYGKNINDAYYSVSQLHLDFGRLEYAASPAEYGVRVGLEF